MRERKIIVIVISNNLSDLMNHVGKRAMNERRVSREISNEQIVYTENGGISNNQQHSRGAQRGNCSKLIHDIYIDTFAWKKENHCRVRVFVENSRKIDEGGKVFVTLISLAVAHLESFKPLSVLISILHLMSSFTMTKAETFWLYVFCDADRIDISLVVRVI